MRAAGLVSQLIVSVLFARLLGATEFGVLVFVLTIAALIGSPLQMAVNTFAVRWLTRYQTRGRGQWAACVRTYGARFSALASIVAFVSASFLAEALGNLPYSLAAIVGAIAGLTVGTDWNNGVIRASHRPAASMLVDNVVRPGAIIGLGIVGLVFYEKETALPAALIAHLIAATLGFAAATLIRRQAYGPTRTYALGSPRIRHLFARSMWGYVGQGALTAAQAQGAVALIWFLGETEDVGYLRIAMQLSMVIVLGLSVSQFASASRFAEAIAKAQGGVVRVIFGKATRLGLIVGFPVAVVYAIWGEELLAFMYGAEYAGVFVPLLVICAGQLLNLATGPVGTVLNMSGGQKYAMAAVFMGMVAQLTVGGILAVDHGVTGMAIGVSAGIVVMNGALLVFLLRHMSFVRDGRRR